MGQRHVSNFYKFLTIEASGGFWKKHSVVRDLRYDEDKHKDSKYVLVERKTGHEKARMTARSLPGCCGVVLFHSFSGEVKDVVELIKLGFAAGKRAKYGQAIFTLKADSRIFDALTSGDEDNRISFLNGKTGNTITTAIRDLKQNPTKRDNDLEAE